MLAGMSQVNPLEFTFIPKKGWKEKTSYRLLISSKHLVPIEGRSFPEPSKTIDIISKNGLSLNGKFINLLKQEIPW